MSVPLLPPVIVGGPYEPLTERQRFVLKDLDVVRTVREYNKSRNVGKVIDLAYQLVQGAPRLIKPSNLPLLGDLIAQLAPTDTLPFMVLALLYPEWQKSIVKSVNEPQHINAYITIEFLRSMQAYYEIIKLRIDPTVDAISETKKLFSIIPKPSRDTFTNNVLEEYLERTNIRFTAQESQFYSSLTLEEILSLLYDPIMQNVLFEIGFDTLIAYALIRGTPAARLVVRALNTGGVPLKSIESITSNLPLHLQVIAFGPDNSYELASSLVRTPQHAKDVLEIININSVSGKEFARAIRDEFGKEMFEVFAGGVSSEAQKQRLLQWNQIRLTLPSSK